MFYYIVMLHRPLYGGNFHVDIINTQFSLLFRQTNEFARNILHTSIMYLKASADVKISTFLEKNGGTRLWITKWTFKHQYIEPSEPEQRPCMMLHFDNLAAFKVDQATLIWLSNNWKSENFDFRFENVSFSKLFGYQLIVQVFKKMVC